MPAFESTGSDPVTLVLPLLKVAQNKDFHPMIGSDTDICFSANQPEKQNLNHFAEWKF